MSEEKVEEKEVEQTTKVPTVPAVPKEGCCRKKACRIQ